jgi:hypothetical protein
MKKRINFLFIYISFFILPIILLLSQINISLITPSHLKYFFVSQLILLIFFTTLFYLIFNFFFPILKIKLSLSNFLLINSFFIFLLFYYRPIHSFIFPGDYKVLVNHFIILLGYIICYIIFFYFYFKVKKLINVFFTIYILINFFIFLIYIFNYSNILNINTDNIVKIASLNNENNKNQWLDIKKSKVSSNKTDIFLIVFDGMLSLDRAEKLNIINDQAEHIKQLNLNGFNYVDDFTSNYIPTSLSLASILGSGFPVTDNSRKYKSTKNFFPRLLYDPARNHNFYKIINNLDYNFIWAGNDHADCIYNIYNNCFTKNSQKDFITKLRLLYLDSIFVYIINYFSTKVLENEIDAEDFLSDVSIYKNSKDMIKGKSVYLIHLLKPHPPFEFDKYCNKIIATTRNLEPNVEAEDYLEKYKIAYNCSLKLINNWIDQKSKNKDKAITFIFGDHGWFFSKKIKKKVRDEYNLNEVDFRYSIYFSYKIPKRCKNLETPKSSVNIMRFAMNCAENLDLEFLEDKRYINYPPGHKNYGLIKEYKKEEFDPNCYSIYLLKKTSSNAHC